MPDRTKLKVGDRIHLPAVPEIDQRQKQEEIKRGLTDAGWTADTIERILQQNPVVTINRIDEWGSAWFDYELNQKGASEFHSLAIMDDGSWEFE